jgi:hypothetical protein
MAAQRHIVENEAVLINFIIPGFFFYCSDGAQFRFISVIYPINSKGIIMAEATTSIQLHVDIWNRIMSIKVPGISLV